MKRITAFVFALVLVAGSLTSALADGEPTTVPPIARPTFQVRPPAASRFQAASADGYTPIQVRHAYGFDTLTADGQGQVIGIVDAYDAPTIAGDLATFIASSHLPVMNGLPGAPACTVALGPHPCFQKQLAASATTVDSGWAVETSLDVEWAHAVAPGADILLVEAPSAGVPDLLRAVDLATSSGAGVISTSWGTAEYAGETDGDVHFQRPGVAFTASAGDGGSGVLWPAASPSVVAVGGTSLKLDQAGNVLSETAWSNTGGGVSAVETEPRYQASIGIATPGYKRASPDVAYLADPSTGVAVYDSTPYQGMSGWFEVGGTSVGAPQWAGLIALADQLGGSDAAASAPLSALYRAAFAPTYGQTFRDITSGANGVGPFDLAHGGYDFVTGLGTPRASNLVPFLAQPAPRAGEAPGRLIPIQSPFTHLGS